MEKVRVLICGSSPKVKGGITTVINQLKENKWGKNIEMSFLATHTTGNFFEKICCFIFAYIKLIFLLLFNRFDIIHIHMSYKGSFIRKYQVSKICKRFNKKIIIHLHGSEFKDFYLNSNGKRRREITDLFESVDVTFVLGNEWKRFLLSISPRAKVLVIKNSVHIPKKYARQQKEVISFLFLGSLIKRKGVIDLLKAADILAAKGKTTFKVIIAGSGEEYERLKAYVKEKELSEIVNFVGWINRDKKITLLQETDVLILPSYNEGLPMAILEAMSYGMPIISTRVGSNSEAVIDGKNGYLIEPGDFKKLANIMEQYIDCSEKLKQHSDNSRKISEENFSDRIFFSRIEEQYVNL